MTDKLYNGFNNGRDKSDGVGGREVNHGTQQSMTKAEMIYPKIGIEPKQFTDTHQERCYPLTVVSDLMDEWAAQEAAKEREKAKKLVELLHEIDKSLYIGDDLNDIDILKWYLDVICTIKDEIKQSLIEYGQPNSL